MSKMTYTALALFLACSPMAHAELVASQPLTNTIDTNTLAGSLLERSGSLSSVGFQAVQQAANRTAKLGTTPIVNAKPVIANRLDTAKLDSIKPDESVAVPVRDISAQKKPVVAEEDSLMDRMNVLAAQTVRRFNQSGLASWYGRQFNGRPTASGERFDMHAMTAAHRSLPLNCYIRVTNQDNGKSVIVKVNDRGPFHGNRILDLSYAAAKEIGIMSRGVGNVTIERIDPPNGQ